LATAKNPSNNNAAKVRILPRSRKARGGVGAEGLQATRKKEKNQHAKTNRHHTNGLRPKQARVKKLHKTHNATEK
jgi:hypothetical protein